MLPQVMFPMLLSYVGYTVGSIFLSKSLSMSVGILGSVEKENKNKNEVCWCVRVGSSVR